MTKYQPAKLKKLNLLILILISLAITNNAQQNSGAHINLPAAISANTQFGFTENKGQVTNQNFEARPDVLFGGMVNGLVFHLRTNGISYQLSKTEKGELTPDKKPGLLNEKNKSQSAGKTTLYRVDVNWIGAKKHLEVIKENGLSGTSLYYNAAGEFQAQSFGAVRYKNIYSGIDLKYYFKNGELKYDYECSAGSNYKKIKLEFTGATHISLNENGELTLETPLGTIIEHAPVVFQNGLKLKSNWVIEKNVLSLTIENLNSRQPYIIDPAVRVWGTYYGGSGLDQGLFTTTDASGNVYLAGNTDTGTSSVIATSGAQQFTMGGGFSDAFLVKFNSNGVRQWATYYGGNDDDMGQSCVVDGSGNVYLAGATSSSVGIATAAAHQTVQGGGNLPDVFLVKFNSSGVRQWGTYYGGNSYEGGASCALDPSGNVYLSGTTELATSTVIATSGSHQSSLSGTSDAFLAKFNSSGVRQWATYYGGSGSDNATSCATDGNVSVILVGTTGSTNSAISSTACHQSASGGFVDGFVVKFNSSTGARLWGTYYGGENGDFANACATDALGNVYVSGTSNSTITGAIATAASHLSVNAQASDMGFLVKFNTSGVRQWATYYGGEGSETGMGCATEGTVGVYISGTTASTLSGAISTPGSYQTSLSVVYYNNAYLAKFNASGVRQWGTYYGDEGELAANCAADGNGNVYLCGVSTTTSGNVIASSGAHQTTFGGTADCFLVKMSDCSAPASPTNNTSASNQSLCAGNTTTVNASNSTFTITWHASPTSTAVLGTGTTYITPTLSAGNYTYYAQATGSCGVSPRTPVTVTVISIPTIAAGSGTICSGQSFTITPSGASNYSFVSGGNNFTVSPATTTSYAVYGVNSGCTSQNTVNVTVQVNTTPTVSVNSTSICAGASVVITPGGASTYSFINISSGTSISVSPTVTTTYSIFGTSSLACVSQNTAFATVTVNARPLITANSASICAGLSAVISPSGASVYSISGGTLSATSSTNFTLTPAATSSYAINGTSTAGCVSNSPAVIQITVSPQPTITALNGNICSGQSFTINPTTIGTVAASSYSYLAGGNNFTVSPTSNTNYIIYATSAQNCTSSAIVVSVSVSSPSTFSVNSGSICPGQSFTILPAGPATFSINGTPASSLVINPTVTTIYTVTGTGCLSSSVITGTATTYSLPTISVNSASTICVGLSAIISPSGASVYSISGGTLSATSNTDFTVTPATTTSYSINGTSAQGCNSASPAVVQVSIAPTPTISVAGGSICAGASFTFNPSGAANYSIIPGGNNFTVSPTVSSTYNIYGISPPGCTSQTVTVNVVVNPAPNIVATSTSICDSQSYTLIPGGASSYTLNTTTNTTSGTSFVLSPTTTTSYSIIGTNSLGCVSTATAVFNLSVNPQPTITANSATICLGDSAVISPSGANTYSINGGSFTVSPLVNTFYSITGTSGLGCVSNPAVVQVSVLPLPTFSVLGISDGGCVGKTFTISPTATGSVTISNYSIISYPAMTVAPSVSTTYSIIAFSSEGCRSQNSATTDIIVEAGPTITVSSFSICVNSVGKIIPNGATNYSINGVPFQDTTYASVSPAVTTTYAITGTGGLQYTCPSSTPALCTVSVVSGISVSNATICSGSTYTIKPSGGFAYSIQGGDFVVSPTVSTTYTVSGLTLNGCNNPVTASITVVLGPTLTVAPSYTIQIEPFKIIYWMDFDCKGNNIEPYSISVFSNNFKVPEIHLHYHSLDEKIIWNVDSRLIKSGTYTITINDSQGCKATAETMLYLIEPITIPNFFSPNGDGKNDTWSPGPKELIEYVKIHDEKGNSWLNMNQWGNDKVDFFWDGTDKNNNPDTPAPDGVYYYSIYTEYKKFYSGTITLQR